MVVTGDFGERMAKIETDLEYIKQRVDEMYHWQKELDTRYDARYASKNVEKLVYSAVGMVLMAIMGALIYLVASHPSALGG